MSDFARYAVFYAPPAGSDLARFGASWLGWDAETASTPAHPAIAGLNIAGLDIAGLDIAGLDITRITAAPRKYGFHGTLKPPFRLADGTDFGGLEASVRDLAKKCQPFSAPRLDLRRIGHFAALVPDTGSPELAALAAACVCDLDRFRRPPDANEMARRRAAGLSARQEQYLQDWGYPYVLGEFRFHLTLSGKLSAELAQRAMSVLATITRAFCREPLPVREICLFGERSDGRFQVIGRYPLGG